MGSLSFRTLTNKCFIKSILRTAPFTLQTSRFIMTTPFAAEKALGNLKSNPYFDKYSKKIASLQQTSPEEFLARLEEAHVKQSKRSPSPKERQCSSTATSHAKASLQSNFSQAKTKNLSDIMKMELLEDKSSDQIQQIWQEFYRHKEGLAATIPADVFNLICERSHKFPMFLFPLPRSTGYEFIVCQFAGNEVHFTPLINYQTHKENAPECLTVWHFIELMNEKKIVLMRGEFDKNVIDPSEAQCLTNQLQLYYGQHDEKRLKLLERFTYSPGEFKYMDLVAELECLTL